MQSDIDHKQGRGEGQMPGHDDAPVPHLRFLKLLVGGMAVAMVLGLAAIVAILWIRLNTPDLPDLPDAVTLPEGAEPAAVTFAGQRLIVVTDAGEVLVYDESGTLSQQIRLDQP
ncbi:DUF6476 family protein [Paracoccus sp. SCSIO 75233]|uniref:DUF6476 family protein n=1 Tax=Paracoccus sp. SCSIO 75233 TaxID=3017782 RepID=UPI0022F01FCF|nr:DUF6476 family protein [Paracoccus sp. SCSIO 75233]WBU52520.1 DUF6476 family protein [Paracoccus sp. SCSIO 75233]